MDITVKMDALLGAWEQRADRRAAFLRCYRMMTGNTLAALEAQEFHDGPWVRQLLHRFADYYFGALDCFEQNLPDTPAVWSTAHRSAHQEKAFVLQNLLLGINAHINYDLVLTLYEVLSQDWNNLSEEMRHQRYEDHCHVNVIIGRTIDEAQDKIVEAESPYMDIIDKLLGPVDEWSASLLIRTWREEVWHHAQQMLAARDDAERETLRQQIEAITLQRSQTILQPAGLRVLNELFD
jgi:hypothetical protein